MEENYRRYPIGIQNFEQLRNRNCVYVDKTELVYRLANTDSVYFLSRPRRLGKACWCPLLRLTFKGKKICLRGWPWSVWKRTGTCIRYSILISV